jgi:hypothetical protein
MSNDEQGIVPQPKTETGATEIAAALRPAPPPDILLWKATLADQLVAGACSGAFLGAVNGALTYHVVLDQGRSWWVYLGSAWLGSAGGVLAVLWRRRQLGAEAGVEVGSVLGLLYGALPALAVLFRSFAIHRVVIAGWGFVGLLMGASMGGFVVGGVLDRFAEGIIARRAKHRLRPKKAGGGNP